MKYLSFDLGTVHTGVAVSYEGKIAQGLTTLKADSIEKLRPKVDRLLIQEKPDQIVVGQPEHGAIKQLAEMFAQDLRSAGWSVNLVNEDFTSRKAVAALIESGHKRTVRQSREHEVAAAALLQYFLEN